VQVTTAQHPDPAASDDRIFVASNAVIMLDGASAFVPTDVPAADYVDGLGSAIKDNLIEEPTGDLADVLAGAIQRTADRLDAGRGAAAPSSTVAIARLRPDETIDVLVLGDTQVVTPHRTIRDDRLNNVGANRRAAYQARLAAGNGYDEQHRSILQELQREQLRRRNQPGGYWIAEADPSAAQHALTARLSAASTPWLVLATDGAYKPLGHLGLDDWPRLARLDSAALRDLLDRCQRWEAHDDPDGIDVPRAKRHDDKSVASVWMLREIPGAPP
jgi:hypothetical protein